MEILIQNPLNEDYIEIAEKRLYNELGMYK